jgi:hypothetical protein
MSQIVQETRRVTVTAVELVPEAGDILGIEQSLDAKVVFPAPGGPAIQSTGQRLRSSNSANNRRRAYAPCSRGRDSLARRPVFFDMMAANPLRYMDRQYQYRPRVRKALGAA